MAAMPMTSRIMPMTKSQSAEATSLDHTRRLAASGPSTMLRAAPSIVEGRRAGLNRESGTRNCTSQAHLPSSNVRIRCASLLGVKGFCRSGIRPSSAP
jgi:hypothetical protein